MTLAIVSINPDKTVLTQTISKMWELQNKKKKSQMGREAVSGQTIRQVVNKPAVGEG